MQNMAIQMTSVVKRFKQHEVLRGLNLAVPERSIFAFLGNNGEGKSTAIRLMLGLLHPDQGTIQILGRDITRERKCILQQTGCLVEAPSVYPNLTAREFLRIACTLKDLPRTEIDRVLEIVGLSADGRRLIAQYSLGMKQRLALAHALVGSPKLLILDEPGNGLDPIGMQEIRGLIADLPDASNCTVFVSSHQLDEVEKIATHVALLKGGRVQFQSEMATLYAQQDGYLTLTVDDAVSAKRVLMETLIDQVFDVTITSAQSLRVDRVPQELSYRVNACLIKADLRLHQAIFEKPTLEQWFHQRMQNVSIATGSGS
nr:ATP-binding cassette domain-containing protein [uncultured Undibacterium sp.]